MDWENKGGIIKYLISLLEFNIGKDNKIYSEEKLKQFAEKAKLYSILIPINTFSYAVKAKKSKDPDVVKKAERAEIVAFFICLSMLLAGTIGVGSWIFSGTWFALVPIAIIGFIVLKILEKRELANKPMKEKIKKITRIFKEYLPDIIFLIGVWIASYNLLRPSVTRGLTLPSFSYTEHFTEYKVLGIMLIALAFDIAIRRYFTKRNSE